jgi:hypothetical protein
LVGRVAGSSPGALTNISLCFNVEKKPQENAISSVELRYEPMLKTDAYAFLNVRNPLCAWNTYRGILVCSPERAGIVSVWAAGMMRDEDRRVLGRELFLENFRQSFYPTKISRLRGLFCFLDIESAERACSWATGPRSHFRPENLAELSLSEAGSRRDRFDANWITSAPVGDDGAISNFEWANKYWNGEPTPDQMPIWETLIDGRAIILGTAIRERAYNITRSRFPDTLMFLELGRQAACVGSDLGNVFAVLMGRKRRNRNEL